MRKAGLKVDLLIILIAALVLRLALVFVTPHLNASDELGNLNYQRAVCHWQFPVLPKDLGWASDNNLNQFHHGPLLYLSTYPFCFLQELGEKNYLIFLRLYSVVLGLLTIYFIFLIGRLMFPAQETIGLSAAAFGALLPAFANKNATFNVDTISYFWLTLTIYFLIKWLRQKQKLLWKHFLGLGILLGIALWIKSYGIYLLPIYLLWAYLMARQGEGRNTSSTIWKGALSAIVFGLIIASPWLYGRNYLEYGDPLGATIDWTKNTGTYLKKLSDTGTYFFDSFWAIFGYNNSIRLGFHTTIFLWLIFGMVIGGFVKFWQSLKEQSSRYSLYLLGLLMLQAAAGTYQFGFQINQAQARYFFPAIAPVALLFAVGWYELFPNRWKKIAHISLIILGLIFNFGVLFYLVIPAFRAFPETGPWTQTAPWP